MISIPEKFRLITALLGLGILPCAEAAVTFSREIAPIIFENCAQCHRPGQSAPFSLLNYADAKKHASDIGKVTESGYMPPWLPEKGGHEFLGERRLSKKQIELIRQWISGGTLEGDSKDLPALPDFPAEWQFGQPDLVVKMPEPYVLASEGKDLYRNFVIPAPLRQNRFVRALEFHPRNRAVHHVRITFDSTRQSRNLDAQDAEPGFAGMKTPGKFPTGHMINWVPGLTPLAVEDGLQWPLEKDADIVLEVHLQRTGKEESIQPEIGFYFTNSPPTKSSFVVGLASQLIEIPPHETNYVVERELELPVDCLATTILPHMHFLGKEMEVFATLPNGAKEMLLRIPNWDFNWQGEYRYKKPVSLAAGSRLTMRARYDNSSENIRNPNRPPRRVVYGPQSSDEMCEVWIQLLAKNAADLARLQKVQRTSTDRENIALYESRLKENPRNAAVHTAMGKVLGPMGALEEAVRHFQIAIELEPNLVEAHFYLGLSLLEMHDVDGARGEFETTLRYDPAYVKAHDGLGFVALQLNRPAEAKRHFERALELNPDDSAAKLNLEKLRGAQVGQ